MTTDSAYMDRALELAREAAREGEVPIGALVVLDGDILAEAANAMIGASDPTAHAEVRAIRKAAERLGNYRLPGTTLYVTLEPCAMCAGAMVQARIHRLVYACGDPKAGAAGSVFQIADAAELNHRIQLTSGVRDEAAAALLREFFAARRAPKGPHTPV
jgi:tRNA(adenine34) deaminase